MKLPRLAYCVKTSARKSSVEVHSFSPSTWKTEQEDLCELEVSLVYRVTSRATRAVWHVMRVKTQVLATGVQWALPF